MTEVFISATKVRSSRHVASTARQALVDAGLKVPKGIMPLTEEEQETWMWTMMKLNGFTGVTITKEDFDRNGILYKFSSFQFTTS